MSGFGAPFGGGGGGGFGSPPPPGGFGGGFNNGPPPAAAPFGSPPAAASGFPNAAPFGGAAAGFGGSAAPTTFAAPASSFAGAGGPTGFGDPSAAPAFGAPGGGSSGFGQPPQQQQQGFGQPPHQQQQQGFGQQQPQQQQQSFGSSNDPFGSSQGSQQQQQQQPNNVPNPFGASAGAPASSMSFGMSANVVTSGMNAAEPASGGMSFGAPAPAFGNNGPQDQAFGAAPFGSASSGGGGMTFGASANVDMGGSAPTSAFGVPFHDTNPNGMDPGSLSPIPEGMGMGAGPFGGGPFGGATEQQQPSGGSREATQEDKLAKLKAKLEAKKKKLLDKQKRQQQDGSGGPGTTNDASNTYTQEQEQPQRQQRKQPTDKGSHRRSHSRSASPLPVNSGGMSADNQARAERNLKRFATSTSTPTQSFLPSDLRGKTEARKPTTSAEPNREERGKPEGTRKAVTSAVGGESKREDLATAKSLVGTCEFFCPDEELLRREQENDIQLLEIPDPGGVHPPNWTLRNTVVKRFRRSAADYKLDVPEWIRPPDTLEEVCAYLEEWVMERDRQGPDRRFPQNGTPVSMDAYQFIWDRTRMIRKDFILQNYVGTGGKCDARAVRCHERIARWHAMCEHQLSHINDFAVMQSQQNIQELGQAMKTLNQYYDDSLGRALVEVPDDEGRETRRNPGDFSHGCKSDSCQGVNPVDYDGSALNNASDGSGRLIGKGMVNSPTRGTAEPEMRGLYMLLTMNNDGGMEVMRYSAELYRERPEIYNSKPVQLALDIFKAKKDYNYVRFFEYLRSPSTPYLFACIMFKHVELMRKLAFRICSKTYGARKKDTGEPIYDAYPLKKLAHILCFEDMDEARAACKHYNITVKEMKVKSSSSGQVGMAEIVFWRHSEFKESIDPAKGTILPLRPRKMLKCIESKLNGVTRLGVCRGEVSGEGSSLSKVPTIRVAPVGSASSQAAAPQPSQGAPSAAELAKQQQELIQWEQAEAKKRETEKLRLKGEEKMRLEEREKKKLEEREKKIEELKRQKAAKKLEEERKRREEVQRLKEQKEREERERAEQAQKVAQEAARLKEEARQRKLEEATRKKVEAEEKERQRLEALRREEERKQQLILAEQERLRREEEERIRREQERKRLEALRLQEEERKRKEAIARKQAQELEERVNKARKLLLLRRWRQQLPRKFRTEASTEQSIKRIDPTFLMASPFKGDFLDRELALARSTEKPKRAPTTVDTRKILNRVLAKSVRPLDVASMILDILCEDEELMEHMRSKGFANNTTEATKTTFLFKVAVVLPEPDGLEEESMYESIHTWLDKRLEYGTLDTMQRVDSSGLHSSEVRVLFVKADSWGVPVSCDAAMFVIPPSFCNGDWSNPRKVEAISSAFDCIDHETPRVAYILAEKFDSGFYTEANQFFTACLPYEMDEFAVVFPSAVSESALDGSLKSSLRTLINVFTREFPPVLEQVSVMKLASRCVSDTLWKGSSFDSLESTRATLLALGRELDSVGQSVEDSWSNWPVEDFAGDEGLVTGYFGDNLHLPTSWTSRVFRDTANSRIMDLHHMLQKSVPLAVRQLIISAPRDIQNDCEEMLEQRQYRKCLQRALECSGIEDVIFYLPKGTAETIAASTIKSIIGSDTQIQFDGPVYGGDDYEELRRNFEADDQGARVATTPLNMDDDRAEKADAVDDAGVFKRAQDIFEVSRTISPLPPGMMTPTPGTDSPPPGVSSTNNKRSWMGMASSEEDGMDPPPPVNTPHGGYDYYSSSGPGSATKRPREAAYPVRSRDQVESSAFTKKLQALLHGEATIDMEVGRTTLARLVRNTPLLGATQDDQNKGFK